MCECQFESVLFVQFWSCLVFCSLWGSSLCAKYQKNTFLILWVFTAKKNNMADMVTLWYGCINGFIAQKLFNFAEGCMVRKCRQLLALIWEVVIGCYGNCATKFISWCNIWKLQVEFSPRWNGPTCCFLFRFKEIIF